MAQFDTFVGSARVDTENLTGSTTGVQVLSGTTDTKGSWAELESAIDRDYQELILAVDIQSPSDFTILLDVAIGAASLEVTILSNLCVPLTLEAGHVLLRIPMLIPNGSRLAARIQATAATRAVNILQHQFRSGFGGPGGSALADTYGAVTGTSLGTEADPGSLTNTKGSWVELVDATLHATRWLSVQLDMRDNSTTSDARWYIDLGIGAAGSEVVVVADLWAAVGSNVDMLGPVQFLLPVAIPAGVRLAARCQCSTNNTTDRKIGVSVLAFT